MAKGIVRLTDDLGRITIPKEMRRAAGIGERDPVDIYFKDGIICIEPCKTQCVCCGTTIKSLLEVNEVQMCEDCVWKYRDEMAKSDVRTQKYVETLNKSIDSRTRRESIE